jgi:hypothetical protein
LWDASLRSFQQLQLGFYLILRPMYSPKLRSSWIVLSFPISNLLLIPAVRFNKTEPSFQIQMLNFVCHSPKPIPFSVTSDLRNPIRKTPVWLHPLVSP